MVRRSLIRTAAWGALLAMALHALSPLAAPAPRDRAPGLHDLCTSAPAAPQPAGDPSTSHCALCVPPAAISNSPVRLEPTGFHFEVLTLNPRPIDVRPSPTPSSRAPPAGA